MLRSLRCRPNSRTGLLDWAEETIAATGKSIPKGSGFHFPEEFAGGRSAAADSPLRFTRAYARVKRE